MKYIGIDLAWKCFPSPGGTAVSVIDELLAVKVHTVTSDLEILDLVDGAGPCMIGIDASLKVMNETGMRLPERKVRELGVRILPTSRRYLERKFQGSRGERLVSSLQVRGHMLNKDIFETYPYGSMQLSLGNMPRYKHGTLAERCLGCQAVLEHITRRFPELRLPEYLHEEITACRSAVLKQMSDQLDAILCSAYTYEFAIYRGQRSLLVGDEENGFILLGR